jgi:hypothetical protein
MDPLQTFPEEILPLIFNHFRGKDLLKISTVNFYWNEYIGKTKKCMEKIELRIGSDRYNKFTEDDRKSLIVNRDYQNIRVSEATEMFDYVLGIIASLKNWKSVTIFETDLPSMLDFKKMLEIFKKTVENLKLYKVLVMEDGEFGETFDFRELKSLTISGCDDFMFTKVFLDCPSLRTLQLYNPRDTPNPSSIINIIKRHSNIKKFQIDGNWFNYIFSQSNREIIPNLPLQLQELSVYGSGLLVKRIDEVFINFLISQSTTLESLYLGDCLGCELTVIQAALQLRALKNLNMFFLPIGLRFDTIDNPKSDSIENLDILTIDIDNKDKMKFILKSVPNVKNLRLRTMDEETAKFMAKNLKSLQKILSVYMKDEKVVREILPNVRII